jgi:hypothetical protein
MSTVVLIDTMMRNRDPGKFIARESKDNTCCMARCHTCSIQWKLLQKLNMHQ